MSIKNFNRIIVASILFFSLTACINVATTGVQALYQHHGIQKNLKDQYITMQVYHGMTKRPGEFRNTNVTVATYHREILLAGQVPREEQKRSLENIARKISDVKKIYNLVEVQTPSSWLTHLSDTWITTKIKTKLIASNDLDGSKVKVVTENGTVYLMGILLPEQAEIAIDVARQTEGVLKVVKIFSYLKITRHPEA